MMIAERPLSTRPGPRALGTWVRELVPRYPHFDEYDIAELIEEKTGRPITQRDFQTVQTLYQLARVQITLVDDGWDEQD